MISLDCETTGIDFYHGAAPFLVTTCNEEGEVTWWEWDVDPLTREVNAPEEDLEAIEDLLNNEDCIVGQNIGFDFKALSVLCPDLDIPWHKVKDTLLAGHLLSSNTPHDLTSMAVQYLQVNVRKYEDGLATAVKEARRIARSKYPDWLISKKDLPCMPSAKDKTWRYDYWLPRAVAEAEEYEESHPWHTITSEYANSDSAVTLPLYQTQIRIIQHRKLDKIYEERLKILPIVLDMETRGIIVNEDRRKELYEKFTDEAERCRRICVNIADGEIEDLPVNGRSKALDEVVFEKLKLTTIELTPTGKPKMDKFVLDHWIATLDPKSVQHLFVRSLRNYRKRKTALGYMLSYIKFGQNLDGDPNWKILHPSLNPTGTDTLRTSSSGPNEQQISKQEDTNLRYCFGPGPGREWWSMDYQNLELRIPSFLSGEKDAIYVFEHPDEPPYYGSYHLLVADALHPELFAKHGTEFKKVFASTLYQWVKNGNFSLIYGAGEIKADQTYHVEGAYQKIKKRFPKIMELSNKQIALANKCGYVETIPDKTIDPDRGYPLNCVRSKWGGVSPTTPLNYMIQGSACWLTMRAMIKCYDYFQQNKGFYYLVMNIHDECVFDFPAGSGPKPWKVNLPVAKKVASLMAECGDDIGVPTPVGIEYHSNNWAEGVVL